MAIGSAVAAIATALGYGAYAGTITAVVNAVVAVASVATAYSSYASQQKSQKRAEFESAQRNAFRNFRQPLAPRRIIYGRTRVGGPLIFAHNSKPFVAHLVVALASHEVQEIESVWLFKNLLPLQPDGRCQGKYVRSIMGFAFTGSPSQDIGSVMRAATDVRPGTPNPGPLGMDAIISTADKFRGIAALYMITFLFTTTWDGQSPEFSAIVKGKKLYDPRTSTTIYSANPALTVADYLTTVMGVSWAAIDVDALISSANTCDELVALKAGGFERRYEVNGVISADQEHRDVLDTLARAMAGRVRYASGTWIIEAGAPKSSTLAFDESQVLESYEVEFERPDRALPNAVRGNFFDRGTWQPASFAAYEDTVASTAEGGISWLEIDLPLTSSHSMAQRIARIELGRARSKRSLSIPLDLRGLLARPGDVITYSAPEIGVAGLFEVEGFNLGRQETGKGAVLTTKLDLIDYNPAIFNWTPATDEQAMVRGEVVLNNVLARYITDPTYFEILDHTAPNFESDYTFAWGNPDTATISLKQIDIEIIVRIRVTDGTTESNQDVTVTRTIIDGSESALLTVTKTYGAGLSYVSHEVLTANLIARFSNNTWSPEAEATPV